MITHVNEGSRVGSTASNFAFLTRAQHVRFQLRVSLVVCRGRRVCLLLSGSSGNVVCRQTDRQTDRGGESPHPAHIRAACKCGSSRRTLLAVFLQFFYQSRVNA